MKKKIISKAQDTDNSPIIHSELHTVNYTLPVKIGRHLSVFLIFNSKLLKSENCWCFCFGCLSVCHAFHFPTDKLVLVRFHAVNFSSLFFTARPFSLAPTILLIWFPFYWVNHVFDISFLLDCNKHLLFNSAFA